MFRNPSACLIPVALLLLLSASSASSQTAPSPRRSAAGAPRQAATAEPEFLSMCGRCASPTVVAKGGIGTARATAEARMTKDDVTGPDGLCGVTDNACVQNEVAKVYRASADCTAGRITTIQEQTYTLAGLWDANDIGGGRTKWRDAKNVIVGRDNASNGLAISQQWEVLCPAPVSQAVLARAAAAPAPAAARAAAPAQASSRSAAPSRTQAAAPLNPPMCGEVIYCAEVNDFAAMITDFRASLTQPRKVLTVTVRFQNKSERPIILGYVPTSGIALDEHNNRYAAYDADVRGIGLIGGRAVDAKFVLQPGMASDTRFTYYWDAGREVFGTTFEIETTVREILPLANGQLQLGAEYPLRFTALVNGARAGVSSTAAGPRPGAAPVAPPAAISSSASPAAGPVAPPVDRCAGSARACFDGGPFTATVTGIAGSTVSGRHHVLRLNLALTNNTDRRLILGYKAKGNSAIDNLGNLYGYGRPGTHDTSVEGIGLIEGGAADTSFVLAPGQSRNAVFTVTRFNSGPTPQGTSYTFDTIIAELRILPNGQQSETVREYAVHLADLNLRGGVGSAGAPSADDIRKAGEAIRGIFGRKK
jgi:hypothetical protein